MLPKIVCIPSSEGLKTYFETLVKQEKLKKNFLYITEPIKTSITIDQVRQLRKKMVVFQKQTVFVLKFFDTATTEAQNAMLKLLEEGSAHVQFILIVKNIEFILPTIRSRCKIEFVKDVDTKIDSQNDQFQIIAEDLCENANISLLGQKAMQPASRDEAMASMFAILSYLQKRIKKGDTKAILLSKKIFELISYLQFNNMNAQLGMDALVIFAKRLDF